MTSNAHGPFRSFSVLWFPFSVPACLIGTLAWGLFMLGQAGLGQVSDRVDTAQEAHGHFIHGLQSLFAGGRLDPGVSPGLFSLQLGYGLVLYSVFGLAMARCLAVRLSRDEYIGLRQALGFGLRNCRAVVLHPILVLGTLLLLAVAQGSLGVLVQIPYVGLLFHVLLPLAFVFSILMIVVAFTGLLGVPLVVGAISVEQRGTLDAWGKALNYILARPIHVLLYLILLKVLIVDVLARYLLGLGLVENWTDAGLSLFWQRDGFGSAFADASGLVGTERIGGLVRRILAGALDLFLHGFILSTAQAGFTGMFLVLRREVDGIDVADIEVAELPKDPDPSPVAPAEECDHVDGKA